MNYDDEETRKLTILKGQLIEELRTFTPENVKRLGELFSELIQAFEELKNKPERTPEEEENFIELKEKIPQIREAIAVGKDLIGEKLWQHALNVYAAIKKKAEEGDETAMKIYLDLKPKHEAAMREMSSDN